MFANASSDQIAKVEEILHQLDQSQPADPESNRRRAKRMPLHVTLTALVLSGALDSTMNLFTRNISTSGIGFMCRRPCKAAERLAITIELPGRPQKLVLAQITFCRYVRAGLYEVGAEFLECVTGDGSQRVPPHWIPGVPLPSTIATTTPSTPAPQTKNETPTAAPPAPQAAPTPPAKPEPAPA